MRRTRPYARTRNNDELLATYTPALGRLIEVARETGNWALLRALLEVRDERRAIWRRR
jgi:hypothetical protein